MLVVGTSGPSTPTLAIRRRSRPTTGRSPSSDRVWLTVHCRRMSTMVILAKIFGFFKFHFGHNGMHRVLRSRKFTFSSCFCSLYFLIVSKHLAEHHPQSRHLHDIPFCAAFVNFLVYPKPKGDRKILGGNVRDIFDKIWVRCVSTKTRYTCEREPVAKASSRGK